MPSYRPNSSHSMELPSEEFHPIIYIEDPSYARIPDEETRKKARRWRYLIERELGLYNAKTDHVCTDACMAPIFISDGNRANPDEGQDNEDVENQGQYYLTAGPIDLEANLCGCPRSGILHWCPPTINMRRLPNGCTFLTENSIGEQICRLSGRLVYPSEGVYDQYTEDTIAPYQNPGAESKEDREARIASGLNKNNEAPIILSPEQKDEQVRETQEHKGLERLAQNIKNRYQRKTARAAGAETTNAHHQGGQSSSAHMSVVPSLERSPRKNSVQQSFPLVTSESNKTTSTLSSPPLQKSAVGAGKKKKNLYDAGHNLFVSKDTIRAIKKIIIDLIADDTARRDVNPGGDEAAALDPTDTYIDYCIRRVARIYTLVSNERELDRTRDHDRHKRNGACMSLNVKNITITTLYTYAKGFNSQSSGNLIPLDARLARLLPHPKDLCWFGMDPETRKYLKKTSERPQRGQKIYNESMPSNASLQIQQTFTNFPRGEVILRKLLNDD